VLYFIVFQIIVKNHYTPMFNRLFRRKSIDTIMKEAASFSTIGQAAFNGGPGVVFLFIITAVTCGFTALCYAEFAARVPVSGSAYTYSYVTFGEIVAWIIGWALILEYAIGNIVVAISWSAYFNNILRAFGIQLPDWLTVGYQTASMAYHDAVAAGKPLQGISTVYTQAPVVAGLRIIVNLPAFIIVGLVTALAFVGISESKRTANMMVFIKLAVLVFIAALFPNGMGGVLKGVSAVFFAYIGFDAISTTAEECRDPQRDLPRGMLYALIICTVVYVVTALVITGMVHYSKFENITDPLAFVFEQINMKEVGFIISVSAVVAATSVLLVFQLGQPRIWMSMSRDGLLPSRFGRIHGRYRTPGFATVVSGVLVGGLVLFVDDKLVTDLTSIGTLFAFVLVSGGVLLLPRLPKRPGKFTLPYINGRWIVPLLYVGFVWLYWSRVESSLLNFRSEGYQELMFLIFILLSGMMSIMSFVRNYSLIPVLGVLCCMYLMIEIPANSWVVFFGWMGLGLVMYFAYGLRNSRLAGSQE